MNRDKFDKILRLVSSPNDHESALAARKVAAMLGDEGPFCVVDRDDPRLTLPQVRPGDPGWLQGGWGTLVEEEVRRRFHIMQAAFLASQPPRQPRPDEPGWEASEAGRWALAYAAKIVEANLRQVERAGRISPQQAKSVQGTARPRPMVAVSQAVWSASASKATTETGRKAIAAGWRRFASAQYGGPCKGGCGRKIEQGDPCWWKRGAGILCEACADKLAAHDKLP